MSDIYRIAVKLSMESNVGGALSVLSRQFLGVDADVKKLEGSLLSLDRVKMAVFGGLGIAAGGAMLKGLKAITDQAAELNHQLAGIGTMSRNTFTSLGLQADALTAARATAAAVHGTSIDGNAKLYAETYSMFGKAGAARVNEPLAMFGQVLGGITGDYEGASEQLYAMIRAGDLSGKIVDPATHQVDIGRLQRFLDVALKVAGATHGRVGPHEFFAMAQQGGPALATMSDDGLISMAMAAQGMGGFRAGTALSSLFAQAQGGKMTLPVAEEMKRLGLVSGFSTKQGGHVSFSREQLDTPFARAMLADPLHAADLLASQMSKNGINGLEDQTKELFKLLGRQTTQRLLSDFIRNFPQMLAERGRIEGADGVQGQYDKRNSNDYETNLHNVQEAWHNFMAELGLPLT